MNVHPLAEALLGWACDQGMSVAKSLLKVGVALWILGALAGEARMRRLGRDLTVLGVLGAATILAGTWMVQALLLTLYLLAVLEQQGLLRD